MTTSKIHIALRMLGLRKPLIELSRYWFRSWRCRFALVYLAARPDLFDLQLVVSSTRNTTGRAAIAAKALQAMGRTDVPVGVGTETSFGGVYKGVGAMYDWIADYPLDSYPGKVLQDGVGALRDAMRKGTPDDPIYVVEIAPTPNLAEALLAEPSLSSGARVVAMSGSTHIGYDLKPPISAEYNVKENISSAIVCYNASWAAPMLTAPVDTSALARIDGQQYQQLLQAEKEGGQAAHAVLDMYRVWYANGGKHHGSAWPFNPSTATSPLFDFQAAAMTGVLAQQQQQQQRTRGGRAVGAKDGPPPMPYQRIEDDRIYVNTTGYTVVASPGDEGVQRVWPSVAWDNATDPATSMRAFLKDATASIANWRNKGN